MITLFATPKPFAESHIRIIQENAFRSWAKLGCEVIVFGDSEGGPELCRELGFRHVPEMGVNEHGTPLISALFGDAELMAKHDLLCYVNSDIMLLGDFLPAVARLRGRRAMTVGRRTNIDITTPLDFERPDWEAALRRDLAERGKVNPFGGVDHFIFPRGMMGPLPPMALGRMVWDKWLLFHARRRGADLIDGTEVMTAVHQNHGYEHIPALQDPNWIDIKRIERIPEARVNLALAGGWDCMLGVEDATHRMTREGFERRPGPSLRRRLRRFAWLHPRLGWPLRKAQAIVRAVRGEGP